MDKLDQLQLFPLEKKNNEQKEARTGSFVDNMKLPIHRWFRYSAGFSAEWVEKEILKHGYNQNSLILDPFVGSGTTLLAGDSCRVPSVGIEAHPFIARVARSKINWENPVNDFSERASLIINAAVNDAGETIGAYPDIIHKCFPSETLLHLDKLKKAWISQNDASESSELLWLALTAMLRRLSTAGTAQWQYILPNKTKKVNINPIEAFQYQTAIMKSDMRHYQHNFQDSLARVILGDVRNCPEIATKSVDFIITSPPYANNYDYADATRFEMSFWGEINSWGDLQGAVRNRLIVSSSQHASIEKLELDQLLELDVLTPIKQEIETVTRKLAVERLSHGGKKHYHTMIAAYFSGMAESWIELRRMCKPGSNICFVIGDSAPYGIYVPVDRWLGELALAAGFKDYSFLKLRDRNIKWKNRKHRVPLQEGQLWIKG